MNVSQKPRKQSKIINETADVYLNSRSKNKFPLQYAPLKSRNNYDTLKTINRKSIEAQNLKSTTIQTNQRHYYKRQSNQIKKQSNQKRYE